MDLKYGVLRTPEKVALWERNRSPTSLSILDENLGKHLSDIKAMMNCKLFKAAERAKSYIWAMDEHGSIRIAVEELAVRQPKAPYSGYPRRRGYVHPAEEKKLGHPTLLNSGKARIAGELAFDEDDMGPYWSLNANSGRYCRANPPSESQIDEVAARFRELGVDVRVDYD